MTNTTKADTVKFTKEVPIADADGVPIKVGSALKHIKDADRGVVVRILKAGDKGTVFDAIGDVHIYLCPGISRVTNRYSEWRHIPHNEQTYDERLSVWLVSEHFYDANYSQVSKAESLACSGIMALLPDDIVDDDYGPWPDRLEDALRYLVQHLTEKVTNETKSNPPQ